MKSLSTFLVIVMLGIFSNCGSDDPGASKQDEVRNLLTSTTWKVENVDVDGTDQTDVYENLTLKFTSSSYVATNGIPVWPANGTWSFDNEKATSFTRNDGVRVNILEVSSTTLKLGLSWNERTLGSGRINSVKGQHVFSFVK